MNAVCTLLAALAWTTGGLELKLTVQEPTGVERASEPVSGGIPLPAGQFARDQAFALFDGVREVPVQVLPLVVDEQGKLRWVLVDFQTDLKANETRTFTLKDSARAGQLGEAGRQLKVSDGPDGVTIDTGKVSLVISRSRPFGLFESVQSGGKAVVSGGSASYTDGFDGKRYVADKPASVVVEYAGPLRATVCVKGRFVGDEQSKLQWIARVTAWAGHSQVHVKYSLANSSPDHFMFRQIKDSSIELKLASPGDGAVVGLAKPLDVAGTNIAVEQGLRASAAGGAKVVADGKEAWSNAQSGAETDPRRRPAVEAPAGWLLVKGLNRIMVNDLYFTDDPARRLTLTRDSIVLSGVIERYLSDVTDPIEAELLNLVGQKVRDPKTDEQKAGNAALDKQINELRGKVNKLGLPYGAKSRWLFDCSHLSSQYVLDFAFAGDPADKARAWRSRLLAMAPPGWYFQTESLSVGRFGTQEDELKCYDLWGWKYDQKEIPRGPARTHGRFIAGEDNHYETEEDIVESLLLMYLRTGGRAFFDTCEAWANYNMDLQTWRTNGWRYKDGGVWWTGGGPIGNNPQRAEDPVSGFRNSMPAPWTTGAKTRKMTFNWDEAQDLQFLANSKACYCHNWGEGLAGWFCITGDRDALDAAIDTVEQNYDAQKRAFRKEPGKVSHFSRDFTRSCYLTNAARMVVPTDPFVVEASDYLARVYLDRPVKEVRGLVVPPGKIDMKGIRERAGDKGIEEMNRLGVSLDEKTGELTDPKTGARWQPVVDPHTWMFPPMSNAMDCYYAITGSEDAMDWVIAYGQAVAHVLFQPKHGNLSYGRFLVDFPLKGVAKDYASWMLPEDSKDGEGMAINGYLAQFHPDTCAHAYSFCGEPFLKQRAYDYWYWGSHRGYNATKMHNIGRVGWWVNYYGVHSESVNFTGRTFQIWAHPRADEKPPGAVTDLAVTVTGDKARVTFTAPADEGGKAVRYQVKCADRLIVDYQAFLKAFAANEDAKVCNWWMARNLSGEPAPKAPGGKESFEVTGVPADAKFFAVRSFDDSSNRSGISNVLQVK